MNDTTMSATLTAPGPTAANATSVQVALWAASYNAVSSTAFLLAPMLAYFCLCAARQGARPSGGFGKFMIVLELVDAIPEAAIIAGSSVTLMFVFVFLFLTFFLFWFSSTTQTLLHQGHCHGRLLLRSSF
jgi:hypothetical protein